MKNILILFNLTNFVISSESIFCDLFPDITKLVKICRI